MSEKVRPEDSVLVLIDQQVLAISMTKTVPQEVIKANNIALVKTAKILGIPNVWSSIREEEMQEWLPELTDLDPEAHKTRIKRTGIIDAWNQPEFVDAIKATGRRTLLMAGTANDACLLYPAISARRAGYEVHAIIDAAGSIFPLSEQAAMLRMTHEGVTVTSTSVLIGELAYDWQPPTGIELRPVLLQLLTDTMGK